MPPEGFVVGGASSNRFVKLTFAFEFAKLLLPRENDKLKAYNVELELMLS